MFVKIYLYKHRGAFPISESNIPVSVLENIDFLVPNSPCLAGYILFWYSEGK